MHGTVRRQPYPEGHCPHDVYAWRQDVPIEELLREMARQDQMASEDTDCMVRQSAQEGPTVEGDRWFLSAEQLNRWSAACGIDLTKLYYGSRPD